MNINETIAKWLGLTVKTEFNWTFSYDIKNNIIINKKILDFLHDRNQQKWIIDELIKRGYRIKIYVSEYGTEINIWHCDTQLEVKKKNDKIDDTAFIEAVLELIDKENKEGK